MGKKRLKTDHRLYNPTAGIRIDFKRFMNAFIKLKTVRYEEFSKLWCEKKMEYLYLGRNTDREAREFIEEIMLIAQEYFLPPYQFQVRVGGLYMLYAIYEIQPTLPKVKIRMTLSQWNDTIAFEQQASQQKHLDVMYVIHRLYQEKAFLLCSTPTENNPFSNAYECVDREEDLADDLKEERTIVTEHFNFDSLEQVSFLLEQYQRAKISFAGPEATKPDKSLDVLSGNFSDDLVGLIQSYKEEVSELLKSSSQTKVNEEDDQATGKKRKHLKELAFADKASSSKVNQFMDTELGSKNTESRRRSPRKKLADSEKSKIENADEGDGDHVVPTKCQRLDNEPKTEQNTTEQNTNEPNKAVNNDGPEPMITKEVEPMKPDVDQTNTQENAKSESVRKSNRGSSGPKDTNIISSLIGNYPKAMSISMDYCKTYNPREEKAFKLPSFKKVAISANEILVLPPDDVMKKIKAKQFSVMDKHQPKLGKRNASKEKVDKHQSKQGKRKASNKNESACKSDTLVVKLKGKKKRTSKEPANCTSTEPAQCISTDSALPVSCGISKAGEKVAKQTEIIVYPKSSIQGDSGSSKKPAVRGKKAAPPNEALLKLKQKCSADVSEEKSKTPKREVRVFTPDTSLIDDKDVLFDIKREKFENSPATPAKSTENVAVEKTKSSSKKVTNKKKVKTEPEDLHEYKFI